MANVVVVLVVILVTAAVGRAVHRRRRGLVAQRGTSIGADLGALSDQRRVRVVEVTRTGPERVHVLLAPADGSEADGGDGAGGAGDGRPDGHLDAVVSLREQDLGFTLLQEWRAGATVLAIVIPPGSRLVRLRSTEDLQPLTLRRVD